MISRKRVRFKICFSAISKKRLKSVVSDIQVKRLKLGCGCTCLVSLAWFSQLSLLLAVFVH